jgi:uncharacterized membrane protein/thiol-disulfide isomerase/thioredoxin
MNNHLIGRTSLIIIILNLFLSGSLVSTEEPVVYAVLFYSPTCPHCHKIITEDLPPLLEGFGDQVNILVINTYTEKGNELFRNAVSFYNIPNEYAGVPMMVIGDEILIGSIEIPQRLPQIIENGLVSGGIGLPDIPGLAQLVNDEVIVGPSDGNPEENGVEENVVIEQEENKSNVDDVQEEFEDVSVSQMEQNSSISGDIEDLMITRVNITIVEHFMQDRIGNSISTLVLVGMIFSVVLAGVFVSKSNHVLNRWPNWVVSILLIIGLVVAIYMSFVEVTSSEAVCGPVGDCNAVQQSQYATLFGFIPIGLLGVLGYLVIGGVWLLSVFGGRKWQKISLFSLWGLLLFGTLFSMYLTFLEPFVIGASCAWCLTSAVVITLLFWNFTAHIQQVGGLKQLTRF